MSLLRRLRNAVSSPRTDEPVSRRRFFAGAGAAAGGLLLADGARAETGMDLNIEPGTVVDAMGRPLGRPARSDEGMIGEVRLFAGVFEPRGWAFCQGQLLAIASNQALFSILGTIYGGDGRTTFALPDLRGRMSIGPGSRPGGATFGIGTRGGNETHTLTANEIPVHNHSLPQVVVRGTGAATVGVTTGGLDPADGTETTANAGGGQAHNNMPPYLAIHYIIALQGVFPSRS